MIPIWLILVVLATHFVADFICQNDWMALNKSKRLLPLLAHVTVYSTVFLWLGWKFALVNGALHFCVDFVTSKVTSRLWAKQKRWAFFAVIGFDQYLHEASLILTLQLSWWIV